MLHFSVFIIAVTKKVAVFQQNASKYVVSKNKMYLRKQKIRIHCVVVGVVVRTWKSLFLRESSLFSLCNCNFSLGVFVSPYTRV